MATTQQQKLNQTLQQFYQKPVAQVSLELFFSVIMIIFFAFFAIRPTLLTMSDLVKEIDDKEALNQKLAQKIASLSTVQAEYLAAQERLQTLDEALPSQPNFSQAIAIIEKLASDRNLTILSVDAKEIPKEIPATGSALQQKRVSRPVSVTLTGDFPSLRQFIEDLRNVRRTMVVDSIIFSLDENRGKKRLTATITINIEYFGRN